ncbi:Isochorismatase [Caenispirillum salinarum AK4]|uniref:Isochorismatase n=1 Tax=Caenispirillum salinarum AK4 TaxID=1238182 RepID=K9HIY8_9PROT|nr:cysteine hydrolase family protein [Caenispirillum salinarum]EKV30348.1 Isochorismatase [Caenispirillum salinarum AK4]
MTEAPQTLLSLAKADLTPARLAEGVLVLIDCQNEYVDGRLALPGVEPALAEAAALLERARAAGTPVFHIAHQGGAGGPFDPDGPGGAIAEAVAPHAGEAVIRKRLPNAFAGTELNDRVKATGRTDLIVCGFMTHMCVSSTVRAALDLGYRSTVVAAACATRDLPDPAGGVMDAGTLHRASLAALGDRFAVIAPNAQAIHA